MPHEIAKLGLYDFFFDLKVLEIMNSVKKEPKVFIDL